MLPPDTAPAPPDTLVALQSLRCRVAVANQSRHRRDPVLSPRNTPIFVSIVGHVSASTTTGQAPGQGRANTPIQGLPLQFQRIGCI